MIKKFLLVLLLFILAGCGGAPQPEVIEKIVQAPPEIITVVETQIVEVEKIVEKEVIVEVTPLPPKPTPIVEYGVLYFQTKQSTRLWELVGENANGDLVFKRFNPEHRVNADQIVTVYNGRGEGEVAEYYLNDDGSLALGFASFPNAQDFYCDGSYDAEPLYANLVAAGKLDPCSDGDEPEAASPGLWAGKWIDADGNERADDRYFYKVAGINENGKLAQGPGLYIMAAHGFLPSCETAFDDEGVEYLVYLNLSIPASCAQ